MALPLLMYSLQGKRPLFYPSCSLSDVSDCRSRRPGSRFSSLMGSTWDGQRADQPQEETLTSQNLWVFRLPLRWQDYVMLIPWNGGRGKYNLSLRLVSSVTWWPSSAVALFYGNILGFSLYICTVVHASAKGPVDSRCADDDGILASTIVCWCACNDIFGGYDHLQGLCSLSQVLFLNLA